VWLKNGVAMQLQIRPNYISFDGIPAFEMAEVCLVIFLHYKLNKNENKLIEIIFE
jgi:hypothetical protein